MFFIHCECGEKFQSADEHAACPDCGGHSGMSEYFSSLDE